MPLTWSSTENIAWQAELPGERLYVFFGKSGVLCLDLDGNEQWQSSVGERTSAWGSGASPLQLLRTDRNLYCIGLD